MVEAENKKNIQSIIYIPPLNLKTIKKKTKKKKTIINVIKEPSFNIINKYNICIKSLSNQLKISTNVNELTVIASKIIELEQEILYEKTSGCLKLKKEKYKINNKIETLKRQINIAEKELQYIESSLDYKINGQKKILNKKIDKLNDEYNDVLLSL